MITTDVLMQSQNSFFLAAVADEMREPLSIVFETAQCLQSDPEAVNRKPQEILEVLLVQARRLSELVDELLDVIGKNVPELGEELQPLSIPEAIYEELAALEDRTHFVRLNIASDLPDVVAAPSQLRQVFDDLLRNAVKHSPVDTTISISTLVDSEAVEVCVSDEGPGIDPALLPHLFDPFAQWRQCSGQPAGLGFGLYITKQLVVSMNASIAVSSELGIGTTFAVRLPRADWVRATRRPSRSLTHHQLSLHSARFE